MTAEYSDTYTSPVQRILIADDHVIVRRGIMQILLTVFSALEFGEAASADATLAAVSSGHWDLVILDLSLPGRGGLDILPALRRQEPDLAVLVLTMHTEEQYVRRAFRNGASGYLTKVEPTDRLIEAATRVLAGSKYLSPEMAERMAYTLDPSYTSPPHATLSLREFESLRLYGNGLQTAQIASALGVSVRTVRSYRLGLLHKLSLKSTQEIIYYAHRNGFVD